MLQQTELNSYSGNTLILKDAKINLLYIWNHPDLVIYSMQTLINIKLLYNIKKFSEYIQSQEQHVLRMYLRDEIKNIFLQNKLHGEMCVTINVYFKVCILCEKMPFYIRILSCVLYMFAKGSFS